MEEKKKKSALSVLIPTIAALVCVITSVAYIVFKMSSNRVYEEKWQDYDECGI